MIKRWKLCRADVITAIHQADGIKGETLVLTIQLSAEIRRLLDRKKRLAFFLANHARFKPALGAQHWNATARDVLTKGQGNKDMELFPSRRN